MIMTDKVSVYLWLRTERRVPERLEDNIKSMGHKIIVSYNLIYVILCFIFKLILSSLIIYNDLDWVLKYF